MPPLLRVYPYETSSETILRVTPQSRGRDLGGLVKYMTEVGERRELLEQQIPAKGFDAYNKIK